MVDKMKALSLTQPWATLIAIGAKKVETRSWQTSHRGLIAIHAAKGLGPVGGQRGLDGQCSVEPFLTVLTKYGCGRPWPELSKDVRLCMMPLGAIVAIARIADCLSTGEHEMIVPPWIKQLSENERAFGNYWPDRYGWLLEDVKVLDRPVPCNGALGLWEVPEEVAVEVRRQLSQSTAR